MSGYEDRGFAYWNINGTSMRELTRRYEERMAVAAREPEEDRELHTGTELLERLWGR